MWPMKVYFTLFSYPDISVSVAYEGVLYSVLLPSYLRLRSLWRCTLPLIQISLFPAPMKVYIAVSLTQISPSPEQMKDVMYFTLFSYQDISVSEAHERVLYSVILPRYLRLRSPWSYYFRLRSLWRCYLCVSGDHEGVLYSVILPRYLRLRSPWRCTLLCYLIQISPSPEPMKVYITVFSYSDISVSGAHEGVLYCVLLLRYLCLRSPWRCTLLCSLTQISPSP
jgi:hypothetical protein